MSDADTNNPTGKGMAWLRERIVEHPPGHGGYLEAVGVNGRLRLYSDRLVISRRRTGALTLLTVGLHGEKTIPITQITGVELRKPNIMIRGYFRISTTGRDPNGGAAEAAGDDNAVLLKRAQLKPFVAVHDALIERIGRPAGASSISIADEIEKLAGLRDRGILSPAEFEARKQALLNG